MTSETAHSSQTKLVGQSLPIREHGIDYLHLAFPAKKGPIFSFKPLKHLEGLEIQSQSMSIKKF